MCVIPRGRCKLPHAPRAVRFMAWIRVCPKSGRLWVVISGQFQNAFVCVRPPGHHAGTDGLLTTASSCGFCIYNNVMIAAMHALETYPEIVKKIAIVDIGLLFGVVVRG